MNRPQRRRSLFLWLALLSGMTAEGAAPRGQQDFDREEFKVDGRSCFVDKPHQPAAGRPWVWRARFPGYHGEVDLILLQRGFHVAHIDTSDMFGCQAALDHWDKQDWYTLRGSLDNCRLKFEREKQGRVVFLGGSITNMHGWRDLVSAELQRRFPETTFDFVNAGIPSTGSTPGAFRLARDVFGRGTVDLLFEEAAVNDATNFREPTEMLRGMEGILRGARRLNPRVDIVVMHCVDPSKMAEYNHGRQPVVIAQHESVARHYGVPSINWALEVTQRINAGEFTWTDDFKDLHPSPFGHDLYCNTIKRLFDHAWSNPLPVDAKARDHSLPEPLDPFSYYRGSLIAVTDAKLGEGWAIDPSWRPTGRGATRAGFVDVPMAVAQQEGASLNFEFTGTAVGLFVVAGPDAGVIEYRVDDGPWQQQDLYTPWSGALHIPWAHVLAGELAGGKHVLTLRVAKATNAKSDGHAVRIVHFLVNG